MLIHFRVTGGPGACCSCRRLLNIIIVIKEAKQWAGAYCWEYFWEVGTESSSPVQIWGWIWILTKDTDSMAPSLLDHLFVKIMNVWFYHNQPGLMMARVKPICFMYFMCDIFFAVSKGSTSLILNVILLCTLHFISPSCFVQVFDERKSAGLMLCTSGLFAIIQTITNLSQNSLI